jgi:hypothetical protein
MGQVTVLDSSTDEQVGDYLRQSAEHLIILLDATLTNTKTSSVTSPLITPHAVVIMYPAALRPALSEALWLAKPFSVDALLAVVSQAKQRLRHHKDLHEVAPKRGGHSELTKRTGMTCTTRPLLLL